MLENIEQYFLPQGSIRISNIDYHVIDMPNPPQTATYNVNTELAVVPNDEYILVTAKKIFSFTPETEFSITVTFQAIIWFNPETKTAIDWNKINIADEIKNNPQFIDYELNSKFALLIAQITSINNGFPLIIEIK